MADAEREALWQAERLEETARSVAQAFTTWLLRLGTAPPVVRKVLVEQAQVLTDAERAPDNPEHSRDVMARRKRQKAATHDR